MEVTAKPSVARDTFEQHGLKLGESCTCLPLKSSSRTDHIPLPLAPVAAGSTSASPVTSQVRDMAIKTRNDTVVSLSCDW